MYLGIDGTHIRFEEAPRKIPAHHTTQLYNNRKNYYSLNVMIVANDQRIVFVDHRWPGSVHDMRVYFRSDIREVVEGQTEYCMVGDSAYSISETLVKPFSEAEINNEEDAATKRRKTLFNKKLCGARTVMSKNIYGTMKRRCPILKT